MIAGRGMIEHGTLRKLSIKENRMQPRNRWALTRILAHGKANGLKGVQPLAIGW